MQLARVREDEPDGEIGLFQTELFKEFLQAVDDEVEELNNL